MPEVQSVKKWDLNYISNSCVKLAIVKHINLITDIVTVEYITPAEDWSTTVKCAAVIGFNSADQMYNLQNNIKYDSKQLIHIEEDQEALLVDRTLPRSLILSHGMTIIVYRQTTIENEVTSYSYFILAPVVEEMPSTVGILKGLIVQPSDRITFDSSYVPINNKEGYMGISEDFSGPFVNDDIEFIDGVVSNSLTFEGELITYSRGNKTPQGRSSYFPWTNYQTLKYPNNFYIIYHDGEKLVSLPFMCIARGEDGVIDQSKFARNTQWGNTTCWHDLDNGRYYSMSLEMDGTCVFTKHEPNQIGYDTVHRAQTQFQDINNGGISLIYTNPPYFGFCPPAIEHHGEGRFSFTFTTPHYLFGVPSTDPQTSCDLTITLGPWKTETAKFQDNNWGNDWDYEQLQNSSIELIGLERSLYNYSQTHRLEDSNIITVETIGERGYVGSFTMHSIVGESSCQIDQIISGVPTGPCFEIIQPDEVFTWEYIVDSNQVVDQAKYLDEASYSLIDIAGFKLEYRTSAFSGQYNTYPIYDITFTHPLYPYSSMCTLSEGVYYCGTSWHSVTVSSTESGGSEEVGFQRTGIMLLNGEEIFRNEIVSMDRRPKDFNATRTDYSYDAFNFVYEEYLTFYKHINVGASRGSIKYLDANKKVLLYTKSDPSLSSSCGGTIHCTRIGLGEIICDGYADGNSNALLQCVPPILVQPELQTNYLLLYVDGMTKVIDTASEPTPVTAEGVPMLCLLAGDENNEYHFPAPQYGSVGAPTLWGINGSEAAVCQSPVLVKSNYDASLIYILYTSQEKIKQRFFTALPDPISGKRVIEEVNWSTIRNLVDESSPTLTL